VSWHVGGSYFESCNCDAICPCRRIDGRPGGRSTHGICLGTLSWIVEDGHVDDVDVSGLAVALACRYSDDEEGSPWTYVLFLDERGTQAQREALQGVFTGALGGEAHAHFPWAWKASECAGVEAVAIEVSHEPRRQWLRIRDRVTIRIRGRYDGPETVSCVIPGHEQRGEELVADELSVHAGPLEFEYTGVCGYAAARFDYSGV
jgi:hypothetical protein